MKMIFAITGLMVAGFFCQQGIAQGPQITSISANSNSMVSRAPDSRGWTDPALNHNKLVQQQTGDGTFKQIGNFKVQGSPFLFGEHNKSNMFTQEAKAFNIFVSYNTYNQEVEFYSTSNPDKPLVREPGTVDSFTILPNTDLGISTPLNFIYASHLGSKEKVYYQEIYSGARFSLYKRYKSDLGYNTSNYAQSDLRQFDLQIDYFYIDKTSGKGLKKIKPNAATFTKEFKDVVDLSGALTADNFTTNPEPEMKKAMDLLNAKI